MPKKPDPTPADVAAEDLYAAQQRWLEAQQATADALNDLKAAEERLAEAQQPPS